MNYPLIKPNYYFSLFKEIVSFVRKPKNEKNLEKTTKFKIYDTIGLYFLKIVLLIPLVLFFALVYDPENIQGGNMSERFTPLVLLLVGGIILPLIEEVAFRLSLRFKPYYLALSSAVFSYYVLTKVVFDTKISAVDESFMMRMGLSVLVGIILYPIVNIKSLKRQLTKFWTRHFSSIYYITCFNFRLDTYYQVRIKLNQHSLTSNTYPTSVNECLNLRVYQSFFWLWVPADFPYVQ